MPIMPILSEAGFQDCTERSTYLEAFSGGHPQKRPPLARAAVSRVSRGLATPR